MLKGLKLIDVDLKESCFTNIIAVKKVEQLRKERPEMRIVKDEIFKLTQDGAYWSFVCIGSPYQFDCSRIGFRFGCETFKWQAIYLAVILLHTKNQRFPHLKERLNF